MTISDNFSHLSNHVARLSQVDDSQVAFLSSTNETWVIDSGATDHMTSNTSLISPLRSSSVKTVQVANGTPMPITGTGTVSLSPTLSMSSVLFAPKLSNNLLSISQITKN